MAYGHPLKNVTLREIVRNFLLVEAFDEAEVLFELFLVNLTSFKDGGT